MNEDVRLTALQAIKDKIYKKNIHYAFDSGTVEEFRMVRQLGGVPGQSAWLIMNSYRKVGIQMHVSKQVSDDLLATDFTGAAKIENIPWPAPVVEMYFEDQELPTILLMKCTPEDLRKRFTFLNVEMIAPEYITALMQEGSGLMDGRYLSLQLNPTMYEDFLNDAQAPTMITGPMSDALSFRDNSIICYMLHLALKVFTFSSIPEFKPVPLTRKQMHFGGKPGIRKRPERPAQRVVYLPRVIYTPNRLAREVVGREFRGRRGHIHWYKHKRFKIRQGTWDYFPPVNDPKTGKPPLPSKQIKVRKPPGIPPVG